MNKRLALILLTFFDLFALYGLWLGYDVIKEVFEGISGSADSVDFNNRIGFLIFGVGIPLTHMYALCDYLFLGDFFKKNEGWVNKGVVILVVVLFASALLISAGIRTYVENKGYLHCPQADDPMTFSTHLVYTRSPEICTRLVEESLKH